MKNKLLRRATAAALSLMMVLSLLPTVALATDPYTMETKNLSVVTQGSKTDGAETSMGADDYFTILWSTKSKVDTSTARFSDGYESGMRINFGDALSKTKNAVKFHVTADTAVLKVWWASNANTEGYIDPDGNTQAFAEVSGASKNDRILSIVNLTKAGDYYVGGKNYLFKIEVTEGATYTPPATATWNAATVGTPTVSADYQVVEGVKSTDTAEISVSGVKIGEVSGSVYADGVDVDVYKDGVKLATLPNAWDSNRKDATITKWSNTSDMNTLTYKMTATGAYTFKAVAKRDGETSIESDASTPDIDFELPLAAPSVSGASNDDGDAVVLTWDAVTEADSYNVYKDGTKVGNVTALTYTAEGLTAGTEYTFEVEAVRTTPEAATKSTAVKVTPAVKDPSAEKTTVYTFAPGDLTAAADKEAVPANTYVDNTQTVVSTWGTVTKRINSDGAVTSIELGKGAEGSDAGGLAFKLYGTADLEVEFSSTGGSNESPVGLVKASAPTSVIANNESASIVTGTGATKLTWTGLTGSAEGVTYWVVSPKDSTRNRTCRVLSLKLSETMVGERPARASWDGVDDPEITAVALDGSNAGKINVTYTMDVGYDGADVVSVSMLDANDNDKVLTTSIADGGTVSFTPSATGKYKFVITATRSGEDAKKTFTYPTAFDFTLPLAKPAPSVTSIGVATAGDANTGRLQITWAAVAEADGYNVYIDGSDTPANDEPLTATKYVHTGLVVGADHSYVVSAVRGDEEAKASAVTAAATMTQDFKWNYTYFGTSTSSSKNYIGAVKADGVNKSGSTESKTVTAGGESFTYTSYKGAADVTYPVTNATEVTVVAYGNAGKMQPNLEDGVTYFYTTIPSDTNFTLRAAAHVDYWNYSNGQEGFGLLVTDSINPKVSGNYFTNSFMAGATKFAYRYNMANDKIYNENSDKGTKYTMSIGPGVNKKFGATPEGVAAWKQGSVTAPPGYGNVATTLDTTAGSLGLVGGGTEWNLIGNYVADFGANNISEQEGGELVDTLYLEIQKNNTGYFVTRYTDATFTDVIQRVKDYDPNVLSVLDEGNVYVGFCAGRNAVATFSDISLTTIAPEDDAPVEERPMEYIMPEISISSGSRANTTDYTVKFKASVSGTVRVTVNGEVAASSVPVEADATASVKVKLNPGSNRVLAILTPYPAEEQGYDEYTTFDPAYPAGGTVLDSRTVTYDCTYANLVNLYVAPYKLDGTGGTSSGLGTKTKPLTLPVALTVVQPGQTIVLMEGTYRFTTGITIARGMDGTADKPIRMIADPESETRPVLDFQKLGSGFTCGGNYWYFYGFDVTNSSDGNKGFQISGNHNVADNLWTYANGNTGFQLSRMSSTTDKTIDTWPAYNLILNCTSWNNADSGYEDADGFAAKLTVGEGNVFDGCISYFNADDGWDLFAKSDTGVIGDVLIKNCVVFKNGNTLVPGKGGNGNGFKLGGNNMPGAHTVDNCLAFKNDAKGIDSNSGSNIKAYNSVSFGNHDNNVGMYSDATNTDYEVKNTISFNGGADKVAGKGTQDSSKISNDTFYSWNGTNSANKSNAKMNPDDTFVSYDYDAFIAALTPVYDEDGVLVRYDGLRYDDPEDPETFNTINMHGFLELKDTATIDAGVDITKYTPSEIPTLKGGSNSSSGSTGGSGSGGSGGGGGGGSSSGTTTPSTGDTTTPSTGDTTTPSTGTDTTTPATEEKVTVSVDTEVTVNQDGTASVTVSDADVTNAVNSVAEQGADAVVIQATTAEGESADKVGVTIPATAVSAVADNSSMDVTVKTDMASVTIGSDALNEFSANEADVSVSVEAVKDDAGNTTGEIKVEVASKGETLDTVTGGLTVAVPTETEAQGNVLVVVDAEGNETIVKKSVVDETGVAAIVDGSCTVKVVDNTKTFDDAIADWAKPAVEFVTSREIFNGTSNSTFSPELTMNRAMLATVLYRLEDATAEGVNPFADVAHNTWYTDAVIWANAEGIVTGTDLGFEPDRAISRQEIAVMMYRYAKSVGVGNTDKAGKLDSFADSADVASWANEALAWAVGTGLMGGRGNNDLAPTDNASRAEVAIMTQRLVKMMVK